MIYTVTLNPSIDYVMAVPDYISGATNRAQTTNAYPGGKGINVSRILETNHINNQAWGFLGGYTGAFIATTLQHLAIKTDFTPIQGTTRINVKLKSHQETEINASGPQITDAEWQTFKQQFSKLQPADTVVFSGSLPSTLPHDAYQQLIQLVVSKQANFIIDTTGDDLKQALALHPLLVKPNRDEVQALFELTDISLNSLKIAGQQLIAGGAQQAIISLGGDGALLFANNHVYFAEPIAGDLQNSVGAGDSMIGGFLAQWTIEEDPVTAFKLGVASATATAFSEDIATQTKIRSILDHVHITEIG